MKMWKIKRGILSFCACLLFGSLTTNAFGEDTFDPVKVLYLKNGEPMRCQIGVIEGTMAVCRNFGGSASVPLRIIDLDKTFPKFKRREGETVILVQPGQVYQDENIILSNLYMVREDEESPMYDHPGSRSPSDLQPSHYVIFFDLMNRGDSCEVRATVAFRDKQGNIFHQIDVPSESRVPAGGMAFLKKRLEFTKGNLENQIGSLEIGSVERKNILSKSEAQSSHAGMKPSRAQLREEKIRALTENFLRERPQPDQ
jgi:hypothetical protein